MNKTLILTFFLVFVICVGLAAYYVLTMRNSRTSSRSLPTREEGMNLISTNCKELPTFRTRQDNVAYVTKLFSALGNDISYNEIGGMFVSTSNKQFSWIPLDAESQRAAAKREPILLLPAYQKKLYCWVADIEETPGVRRVAYETTTGEIKTIVVAGFLVFPTPIRN